MINPLCVLINTRYIPSFPYFWDTINRTTLVVGFVSIVLFVLRYALINNKIDVKEFIKKHVPISFFLYFAILMVVTTMLNGWFYIMIHGFEYRKEGLLGYLGYIVYFIIIAMNSSDKQKKIWLYAFVGTSAVLELITIYEQYVLNTYDMLFVFSQFNHYGYYILMSLAVSAMLIITSPKKWQKALFSVTFFIATLSLVINDTFGCQISALASLIFACVMYSIAKSKLKPVTLIPIALFILTFVFGGVTSERLRTNISSNFFQIQNDTNALANGEESAELSTGVTRIILWKNGLRYIAEEPLKGHGADATLGRMFNDSNGDNERCHCEYMNYAICFGIPAALVYIAAIFTVYLRGLKYRKKLTDTQLIGLGAAMFYLISAVIGNSMYYTTPYLFILLGLGYFTETKAVEANTAAEQE
ncbi:MAG: O-antigen ligase family protein [Oscillospiraceae bacterium]|nr:O-antigen ligase family protein [Oscillospiraceae bacterium]